MRHQIFFRLCLLLVLCGAATTAFVVAPLRRSVSAVVSRRASESSSPPPPLFEEGALVSAQDIHGVWYAAQVLETGSLGYYVHYLGWEDWWDEWIEESRVMNPDLVPQSAAEPSIISEESLAADRIRNLESNDLWQFDSFQKTFQGKNIRGTFENIYKGNEVKSFEMSFERRDDDDGQRAHESFAIQIREDGDSVWPFNAQLSPRDFRGDTSRPLEGGELGGAAANVNAFSAARFCPTPDGDRSAFALVNDLWLRKGPSILGLRVSYREDESASVSTRWILDSASLFRLGDQQGLLDFGTGLADPHPLTKDNIVVSREDRVTCAFPETINKDAPGVISLDWTVDKLRCQVDRVFERPDASLASFEITDILDEYSQG